MNPSASPPDRPHLTPNQAFTRGFTTIELLVVIAIIGIIAGILVVAFGNVAGGTQQRQTVALLERLNNAVEEFTQDPAGRERFYAIQLPSIYFYEPNGNPAQSAFVTWHAVPASALESQARTGRVLEVLRRNESVRKMIDDLPAERKRKIKYKSLNIEGTQKDYEPEMLLDSWGNPILFVFDNLQKPTGERTSLPLMLRVNGTETPTGGLFNLYSTSTKTYWQPRTALSSPAAPTYYVPTPAPGNVENMPNPPTAYMSIMPDPPAGYRPAVERDGSTAYAFRSSDRRPFWVSAGPDGKYETHDDNIYSFGN